VNIKKNIFRLIALLVAFIVGWAIYVIGLFSMPYPGVLGILFQLLFGAFVSGIIVLASYWMIGWALRKYIPTRFHPSRKFHFIIILLSFLLLIFCMKIGLTQQYTNPEIGETFQSLNANVAFICYILIVFFIANCPTKIINR
jgi:membrane protease YdiL (CAAX protease family)